MTALGQRILIEESRLWSEITALFTIIILQLFNSTISIIRNHWLSAIDWVKKSQIKCRDHVSARS